MCVGLLDYVIKVSDRLMAVYQKNELKFRHG